MKEEVIKFKNVSVLRHKKILDRISFCIRQGQHTAILGPNGSGKSTIIKLISRDIYPLQDEPGFEFKIWGRDDWDVAELRKKLGIVTPSLQENFNRDIPAIEVVVSGYFSGIGIYKNMKYTKKMINDSMLALKKMGVDKLALRTMDTLSTGEARRVLIARALVHNPKALLLDEPTGGLDMASAINFRKKITRISKTITIIIATHDVEDLIPEIKRVILLKNGKIFMDTDRKNAMKPENLNKMYGMKVYK